MLFSLGPLRSLGSTPLPHARGALEVQGARGALEVQGDVRRASGGGGGGR